MRFSSSLFSVYGVSSVMGDSQLKRYHRDFLFRRERAMLSDVSRVLHLVPFTVLHRTE